VSIAIQFTSQVVQTSSENAYPERHEFAVMLDQIFPTLEFLLIDDLAAPILELASRGLSHGSVVAVSKNEEQRRELWTSHFA
jgi:hypothetical protein